MKNYIPLAIIIAAMAVVFAFNSYVTNNIEYELLTSAANLHSKVSENLDCTDEYNEFVAKLKKAEVKINMIYNHSAYNDIAKCVLEIGNDIEYDDKKSLSINVEKLIFYLKDIIGNEKAEINNIL